MRLWRLENSSKVLTRPLDKRIRGRTKQAKREKKKQSDPMGFVSADWPVYENMGIQPENRSIKKSNKWIRSGQLTELSVFDFEMPDFD